MMFERWFITDEHILMCGFMYDYYNHEGLIHSCQLIICEAVLNRTHHDPFVSNRLLLGVL